MVESDLFREVDEELKREQYAKLWDKYGFLVIGAAAAVVIVVAGYKYWKHQQTQQAERYGTQYIEALGLADGKDKAAAAAQFGKIAAEAPVGYATLAKLRVASLAAADGKADDAVASYDKLAKDGAVEPTMRDFAAIEAAALRIENADFAEMQERLGKLADGDSTWRHSARELLGLAAYKAGDHAAAEQWYNRLSDDPQTPSGFKQRAEMMVALIFEANQNKPAAPAASPAPAAAGAPEKPAGQ